jgi:hypothetical protein
VIALASQKQMELINDMLEYLDTEFDYGQIKKKKYYSCKEASDLINLNKDLFYQIIDCGQCSPKQYNLLTKIAGRKPKFERHEIGFSTAAKWIEQYYKKKEVV